MLFIREHHHSSSMPCKDQPKQAGKYTRAGSEMPASKMKIDTWICKKPMQQIYSLRKLFMINHGLVLFQQNPSEVSRLML